MFGESRTWNKSPWYQIVTKVNKECIYIVFSFRNYRCDCLNVVKRERFLFVSIITGTVQEIVQVERVAVRIFVKFEVHRREKLKILWDARDLVLVEVTGKSDLDRRENTSGSLNC